MSSADTRPGIFPAFGLRLGLWYATLFVLGEGSGVLAADALAVLR